MKKTSLILTAGIALIATSQFSSCKKDEKKDEPAKSIVGTWVSESAREKSTEDGVVKYDINLPYANFLEFKLNADNTMTTIDRTDSPETTESGTYSISGSTIYTTSSRGEKDTTQFVITSDDKLQLFDVDNYIEDGVNHVDSGIVIFKRK